MEFELPTKASEVGRFLHAEVAGDGERVIRRLAGLNELAPGCLCFIANRTDLSVTDGVRDAVFLVQHGAETANRSNTYLHVADPKIAFANVARALFSRPRRPGIHPTAIVSSEAQIGKEVSIGPFAVIEAGARIGDRTVIDAYVFIGEDASIDEDSHLYPHVVVLERVVIGKRVNIFPGSVIGSDGFGLLQDGSGVQSMPQIGIVVIEDDVRIGAKCTVDRATIGATRIDRGSKIDDQVHVGHNTHVGKNSVLCAQSGLSGSVTLGEGVVLGGQAGVADHVTIGDGARMGGQTGTGRDLPGGKDYFMSPAIPIVQAFKVISVLHRLPELERRLKKLESKLEGE